MASVDSDSQSAASTRGVATLNLSTSAQLAFLASPDPSSTSEVPPSVELVPFRHADSCLAVCASLNGGNVLARLVTGLRLWMVDLGVDPDALREEDIWKRIGEISRSPHFNSHH